MKKTILLILFVLFGALAPLSPTQAAYVPHPACQEFGIGPKCPAAFWQRCGARAVCCQTQTDCTNQLRAERRAGDTGEGLFQDQWVEENNFTQFCARTSDPSACGKCFLADPPEAWTALGCVPTTMSGFLEKFLTLGVGMAGGIAFLLILFGGFQILTSAGNPEQLNAGREMISSAVAGLLIIIFSIFLLKLIGVDILGIPGFQ